MEKKVRLFSSVFLLLFSGSAISATLYATNGNDGSNGELYTIDTVAETSSILSDDDERSGPELEMSPDGTVLYFVDQQPLPRALQTIDPNTGTSGSRTAFTNFPGDADIVTALEFVDGTLYGAAVDSGPEDGPVWLVTINTSTGALTLVGEMTGLNRPAGGMDYFNGVMYLISATNNNDSGLYTVNLLTGAVSLVAPITLDTVQQESATGLASADGVMYLIKTEGDTNLYSLNLTTGALTVEFDTGREMNSLASFSPRKARPVPTLSAIGLAALAAMLGIIGFRRRMA